MKINKAMWKRLKAGEIIKYEWQARHRGTFVSRFLRGTGAPLRNGLERLIYKWESDRHYKLNADFYMEVRMFQALVDLNLRLVNRTGEKVQVFMTLDGLRLFVVNENGNPTKETIGTHQSCLTVEELTQFMWGFMDGMNVAQTKEGN